VYFKSVTTLCSIVHKIVKCSSIYIPDEKEKYDPSAFRDTVVQGLTEAGGDLEQVCFIFKCH